MNQSVTNNENMEETFTYNFTEKIYNFKIVFLIYYFFREIENLIST